MLILQDEFLGGGLFTTENVVVMFQKMSLPTPWKVIGRTTHVQVRGTWQKTGMVVETLYWSIYCKKQNILSDKSDCGYNVLGLQCM